MKISNTYNENETNSFFIKEVETTFINQNKNNEGQIIKNKLGLIDHNIRDLTKNNFSNQYKETKNKRNFGIDFGRILAMLFIINHHIIYHGGPLFNTKVLSFDNDLLIFLNTLCCSGVNIFGMISGFVGFHSHKYTNLFYLLFETFFYNFGIAFFFKKTKVGIVNDLINFLFPLFISDYWYFNAYFTMYFFLPLLNKGIKSMEKREMGIFNLSLFLLFSCFDQIRHYSERLRKDFFLFVNGFTYMWLIILYFYGSYFGKFGNDFGYHNKFIFFLINCLILFFVTFLRSIIIIYKMFHHSRGINMTVEYTSPSSVMISICFLNILSHLEIKKQFFQKIVSCLSPLTYGVYLLHNHILVRNYVIKNNYLWLIKKNRNSFVLILIEILESLKIFFFCSFIDYIRFLIFKLLKLKQICSMIYQIQKKIGYKILSLFEFYY